MFTRINYWGGGKNVLEGDSGGDGLWGPGMDPLIVNPPLILISTLLEAQGLDSTVSQAMGLGPGQEVISLEWFQVESEACSCSSSFRAYRSLPSPRPGGGPQPSPGGGGWL